MKVTKNEVEEAVDVALNGVGVDYEIHMGTDKRGKMVIGAQMRFYDSEFPAIFVPVVMDLAEKYGEKYTPVSLARMWSGYVATNGFVENEEVVKDPFPVGVRWQIDDVVLSDCVKKMHIGLVSDEALEAFCCDCLEMIEHRRVARS